MLTFDCKIDKISNVEKGLSITDFLKKYKNKNFLHGIPVLGINFMDCGILNEISKEENKLIFITKLGKLSFLYKPENFYFQE